MGKDDVNHNYKDRLFKYIFGREENKRWTLSLYNAMNGSDYQDPSDIELNTLEDFIYMGMKNDVSFILNDYVSLYEQQSTYNPNMPIRSLIYTGQLYDKYIKQNNLKMFGTKIIRLPIPKLVVFYNGASDKEDEILKLSDAFPAGADSDIEITVHMININKGHNDELKKACRPLYEYSWLVDEIRNNLILGKDDAVDLALRSIPDDFEIKGFIDAHRAEVSVGVFTEFDVEKFKQDMYEDGLEDGIIQGREEGRVLTLISLICKKLDKGKDIASIADDLEETIELVEKICNAAKDPKNEGDEIKIYNAIVSK